VLCNIYLKPKHIRAVSSVGRAIESTFNLKECIKKQNHHQTKSSPYINIWAVSSVGRAIDTLLI